MAGCVADRADRRVAVERVDFAAAAVVVEAGLVAGAGGGAAAADRTAVAADCVAARAECRNAVEEADPVAAAAARAASRGPAAGGQDVSDPDYQGPDIPELSKSVERAEAPRDPTPPWQTDPCASEAGRSVLHPGTLLYPYC